MFDLHLKMLERARVPAAQGQTMALKDKAMAALTKADIEAIRESRRADLAKAPQGDVDAKTIRRPGVKGGEVGINRLLTRLRHLCAWAVAEGFVDATPFVRGGVSVVKLVRAAETRRTRRLDAGEEAALAAATPHLRDFITASLTTACRPGELLGLTWADVRHNATGEPTELLLTDTKTREPRRIAVGSRLRAVLAMRRTAPDGRDHPDTAFVFGNEAGEPVRNVRYAWGKACETAGIHGLHAHDLRREAACRLLEAATDLHDVRDILGHTSVATTNTYLQGTVKRQIDAMERLNQAAEPAPTATKADTDLHTVCTNASIDEDGQTPSPAVTH